MSLPNYENIKKNSKFYAYLPTLVKNPLVQEDFPIPPPPLDLDMYQVTQNISPNTPEILQNGFNAELGCGALLVIYSGHYSDNC